MALSLHLPHVLLGSFFFCLQRIYSGRGSSLAAKDSSAPGAEGDGTSLSSSNASSKLHPAEPDLVASTKSGSGESSQPVAPPRKRKQNTKGGLRVNTTDDSDCVSEEPCTFVHGFKQRFERFIDVEVFVFVVFPFINAKVPMVQWPSKSLRRGEHLDRRTKSDRIYAVA